MSGDLLALGAVGVLAAASAARRGSSTKLTPIRIGYVCNNPGWPSHVNVRPTLAQWLAGADLDALDTFIIDLMPYALHVDVERMVARAGFMEEDRERWRTGREHFLFGGDAGGRVLRRGTPEYNEKVEELRHLLVRFFDGLGLAVMPVTSTPIEAANCFSVFLDPASMFGYAPYRTRRTGSTGEAEEGYLVFHRADLPPELFWQPPLYPTTEEGSEDLISMHGWYEWRPRPTLAGIKWVRRGR